MAPQNFKLQKMLIIKLSKKIYKFEGPIGLESED